MSYGSEKGEPSTHCTKCVNTFAFAPISTVRYNTRANSAISKSQGKVNRAAEKYRTSHDAMLALSDLLVIAEWNDTLLFSRLKTYADYRRC